MAWVVEAVRDHVDVVDASHPPVGARGRRDGKGSSGGDAKQRGYSHRPSSRIECEPTLSDRAFTDATKPRTSAAGSE